jgi:hypothetical protein
VPLFAIRIYTQTPYIYLAEEVMMARGRPKAVDPDRFRATTEPMKRAIAEPTDGLRGKRDAFGFGHI